uniref:Putative midasin ixodes scapularis midasin n=1 Tax=Amblyomma triste TaxID=251400 RepID=A0A023GBI0_AMBTT
MQARKVKRFSTNGTVRLCFPAMPRSLKRSKMEPSSQSYVEPVNTQAFAFSGSEALEVWRAHCLLSDPDMGAEKVDCLRALMLRHEALRNILQQHGHHLDAALDVTLQGYHLVSCQSLKAALGTASEQPDASLIGAAAGKGHHVNNQINLYHDAYLLETSLCEDPLKHLLARIQELLAQFPGHPGLTKLKQVCNRVLNLPVSSPVMKVLQGLEILLALGEEWEKGAHRKISIAPELNAITHLVLRWRKMELHNWSQCLDGAHKKIQETSARLVVLPLPTSS